MNAKVHCHPYPLENQRNCSRAFKKLKRCNHISWSSRKNEWRIEMRTKTLKTTNEGSARLPGTLQPWVLRWQRCGNASSHPLGQSCRWATKNRDRCAAERPQLMDIQAQVLQPLVQCPGIIPHWTGKAGPARLWTEPPPLL